MLVTLLLTAPAVALASHQFPDVADDHPFHDEIGAIAEAGITAGFDDDTYRPSDPVTRQAMAAFMQRGFGRVGLSAGTAPMTESVTVAASSNSSGAVAVRQLTITVAGANNDFTPNQLVHLQGRVTFETSMNNSAMGCPCEFHALILDMTTNAVSPTQAQTFESGSLFEWRYSFDVEALFAAPPGPRTYQLWVVLNPRLDSTNMASFDLHRESSLSAMTVPFRSDGHQCPVGRGSAERGRRRSPAGAQTGE